MKQKKPRFQLFELYGFHDGNDDILSDIGNVGANERHGMWAIKPYDVSDGPGVVNEDYPPVEFDALDDKSYATELAQAVANKLDLGGISYLGYGGNGVAFAVDNKVVLKLTIDLGEADAAFIVLRNGAKYLADIYNIFKVVDTETNKSVFAILQENILNKPVDKFVKMEGDINKISPEYGFQDLLVGMKRRDRFDYNKVIEYAKSLLSINPEANVSQADRKAASEHIIGLANIRKELIDLGIRSTDYIAVANLGYSNGVLKFFDVGGHMEPEPNVGKNVITLPENVIEGQVNEDYPRERADAVAAQIGKKLGVEPHYMGYGFFGVAYDIGDNKVLKITSDNSEAAENLNLIGKPLKYIAQPYKVFKVESKTNPDFPKTYAIVLEKLKTDAPYFKRMYDRLEYAFKTFFDIDYKDALEAYLYGHQFDHDINKTEVDHYFKKNSEDADFFFGVLRIAEELNKYGVDSVVEYYNPENLGYKKSGALALFDVGFGNGWLQPDNPEKIDVNVDEDGSSKFSTDSEFGQDGFPPYSQNDTSPMNKNDLDANSAMYGDDNMDEDLKYNHVKGDATDDEYMLTEVVEGGEYKAYHGSDTKIDRFVDDFMGKEEATDQEGPGIYFSTNIEDARAYGKYIHSVILRPRKFVDETSAYDSVDREEIANLIKMAPDWESHAQNWAEDPNAGLWEAIESIILYSRNEKDLFQQVWYDFFRYNPLEYVRGMVKLGYDGQIITKAEGNKHFIVYNPDIIETISAEELTEDRKKAWVPGSKAVTVKKRCRLGGKADGTSDACNQGDINNLEFSSLNEVVAKSQEEVDNFIADSKVKETVYHGSPVGGIEDFKEPKGGGDAGQVVVSSGLREDAIYFTSNPRLADVYRGKKLNPEFKDEIERQIAVLRERQYTVRNNREWDAYGAEIEKLENKLFGQVYGVKLKIKNPLIFDGKGKSNSFAGNPWNELEIDLGYKTARGKEAVNLIATRHEVAKNYWKYDGIIGKNIIDLDSYTNKPDDSNSEFVGDVYAVFSPNQTLILDPELMDDRHGNFNVGGRLSAASVTEEGVGDKYAEKFGVKPEFDNFEDEYRKEKSSKENKIIYSDPKIDWQIIMNPQTLDNIGKDVRGVIDKAGNFFVEQQSRHIHKMLIDILNSRRLLSKDYMSSLDDTLPTDYVTVTRLGDTNKILLGESNQAMYPDELRPEWGFEGYPSHAEAAPVYQKYIDAAKRKNPRIDFVNEFLPTYGKTKKTDYSKLMIEGDIMQLGDLPFKDEVEKLGGEIYAVGGAIRDEFLGKESKDLDIVIRGVPEDKLAQILNKYGTVKPVGNSFAVTKFIPTGGNEKIESDVIDIAIPRTEVSTGEGHNDFKITADYRLPIEKDLERRDFTVNAIAKDMDGNIIDPFNGVDDLKAGEIRITHPKSFIDDSLRMLRAIRFASIYNFKIDPETYKLIQANADKIGTVDNERIQTEFEKIVNKGDAQKGAVLLKDSRILRAMGVDAPLIANGWDKVNTLAEFVYLLSHNAMSPVEFYKNNFRGDTDIIDELEGLVAGMSTESDNPLVNRVIAHNMVIKSKGTDVLRSQILPKNLQHAAQELLQGRYPKVVKELAVNGHDLMGAGLRGKEVGDMQKTMLTKVYADEIRNDREELLSLIQQSDGLKEGWDNYENPVWEVNGEMVGVEFFMGEYDIWNTQGGKPGYPDPSHESVLEFLQNNYEDFSKDDRLKKELYWALTDRDLLTEKDVKNVRYSAVVLDDESRARLLKVFSPMIPEGWKIYAHHMTIKMGPLDIGSNEKNDMSGNTEITLKVVDYGIDDKVMAVGVEGYHTQNAKAHVTLAVNTANGGKPFLSNKLTEWRPLGFPLELTGKVSEEE